MDNLMLDYINFVETDGIIHLLLKNMIGRYLYHLFHMQNIIVNFSFEI